MEEGRRPVANPKKVIAYEPGNSSFMHARNREASSLVSVFGSSSVYVSCSDVSKAGTPSAALKESCSSRFALFKMCRRMWSQPFAVVGA